MDSNPHERLKTRQKTSHARKIEILEHDERFFSRGRVTARLRALPIPESSAALAYPSRFIAFEMDSRIFLGTESNAEPTR